MKKITLLFISLISLTVFSQKKSLKIEDVERWNQILNTAISQNGQFVVYDLKPENSNSQLILKDNKGNTLLTYNRGSAGHFTYDSNFLTFTISPDKDSVMDMKRRKVKKNDLPKDSLAIFNLATSELVKIPNVKSYSLPEKWTGYVAYYLEDAEEEAEEQPKDSVLPDPVNSKKNKPKKVSKTNGFHLVVRDLSSGAHDTFKFVNKYVFAEEAKKLSFATTGDLQYNNAGVFVLDFDKGTLSHIHKSYKANYTALNFSKSGEYLGFVADMDTTKVQIRPNELYYWKSGQEEASKLLDTDSSPDNYQVSSDRKIHFSDDESKLFFGLRTPTIVRDTTLLSEEIVNVEVWTYDEPRLYTLQELQLENDTVQSYLSAIHLSDKRLVQIANKEFPEAELGNKGNAKYALASTAKPYSLERQWTGWSRSDYSVINTDSGERDIILNGFNNANLSPDGNYVYGYRVLDSTWYAYNISKKSFKELTPDRGFYDELNDTPNHPYAYGHAGWTKDDKSILLYDRYDIWEIDPDSGESKNLTNGRANKIVYRYEKLDDDLDYIDKDSNWILSTFNETTKDGGYVRFNPKSNKMTSLVSGPYRYRNLEKAQQSDDLIFTRESFKEFPNLWISDLSFKAPLILSDANPQQDEYKWGTIETVEWVSLDGETLQGLLVKPEDFDPNKKYPMIVNFYERSSDGLHNHRGPYFHRSTINYAFYVSRGYVIFNPDVTYRIGYPGESAFNSVIPGVTSIVEQGFIDEDRIGVQGHSWGGYQIAHLITKTDIFKAAESGAPVVNMFSAYGGIRWGSGLSRQFQYEHTQSRIGGTPWEYPLRYIENSPVFNLDKINTPVLILHNDNDGAVPWYQGIEFFTGLRRLGKPAWFLNYNNEPHWPLKYQNRKDFNIRMSQFFDHYLMDAPEPAWMANGVPAIEKGINQGYELLDEDKN